MVSLTRMLAVLAMAIACSASGQPQGASCVGSADIAHGGGLNACGCHFNRKTGECHCHQPRGCGCACQPGTCPR